MQGNQGLMIGHVKLSPHVDGAVFSAEPLYRLGRSVELTAAVPVQPGNPWGIFTRLQPIYARASSNGRVACVRSGHLLVSDLSRLPTEVHDDANTAPVQAFEGPESARATTSCIKLKTVAHSGQAHQDSLHSVYPFVAWGGSTGCSGDDQYVWVVEQGVLQLVDARVDKPVSIVGAMGDPFMFRAIGLATVGGSPGPAGSPWSPVVMASYDRSKPSQPGAATATSHQPADSSHLQASTRTGTDTGVTGTMRIYDIRGGHYTQVLPPTTPAQQLHRVGSESRSDQALHVHPGFDMSTRYSDQAGKTVGSQLGAAASSLSTAVDRGERGITAIEQSCDEAMAEMYRRSEDISDMDGVTSASLIQQATAAVGKSFALAGCGSGKAIAATFHRQACVVSAAELRLAMASATHVQIGKEFPLDATPVRLVGDHQRCNPFERSPQSGQCATMLKERSSSDGQSRTKEKELVRDDSGIQEPGTSSAPTALRTTIDIRVRALYRERRVAGWDARFGDPSLSYDGRMAAFNVDDVGHIIVSSATMRIMHAFSPPLAAVQKEKQGSQLVGVIPTTRMQQYQHDTAQVVLRSSVSDPLLSTGSLGRFLFPPPGSLRLASSAGLFGASTLPMCSVILGAPIRRPRARLPVPPLNSVEIHGNKRHQDELRAHLCQGRALAATLPRSNTRKRPRQVLYGSSTRVTAKDTNPNRLCSLLPAVSSGQETLLSADVVGLDQSGWNNDPLSLAQFECSYQRGPCKQMVYVCITCLHNKQLSLVDPAVAPTGETHPVSHANDWSKDPVYSEEAKNMIQALAKRQEQIVLSLRAHHPLVARAAALDKEVADGCVDPVSDDGPICVAVHGTTSSDIMIGCLERDTRRKAVNDTISKFPNVRKGADRFQQDVSSMPALPQAPFLAGIIPFGVCVSCALQCHARKGHHVIECKASEFPTELGQISGFRCDCGTARSACNCLLKPVGGKHRGTFNAENADKYNHNFFLEWCYCSQPMESDAAMVQCAHCSDWFHEGCLVRDRDSRANRRKETEAAGTSDAQGEGTFETRAAAVAEAAADGLRNAVSSSVSTSASENSSLPLVRSWMVKPEHATLMSAFEEDDLRMNTDGMEFLCNDCLQGGISSRCGHWLGTDAPGRVHSVRRTERADGLKHDGDIASETKASVASEIKASGLAVDAVSEPKQPDFREHRLMPSPSIRLYGDRGDDAGIQVLVFPGGVFASPCQILRRFSMGISGDVQGGSSRLGGDAAGLARGFEGRPSSEMPVAAACGSIPDPERRDTSRNGGHEEGRDYGVELEGQSESGYEGSDEGSAMGRLRLVCAQLAHLIETDERSTRGMASIRAGRVAVWSSHCGGKEGASFVARALDDPDDAGSGYEDEEGQDDDEAVDDDDDDECEDEDGLESGRSRGVVGTHPDRAEMGDGDPGGARGGHRSGQQSRSSLRRASSTAGADGQERVDAGGDLFDEVLMEFLRGYAEEEGQQGGAAEERDRRRSGAGE